MRSYAPVSPWMRAGDAEAYGLTYARWACGLGGGLGLAPAAGLAARLRPIEGLVGLRQDVLSVAALDTLVILAVHVPSLLHVATASGTCLELYHLTCSVLSCRPDSPPALLLRQASKPAPFLLIAF